MRLVETAVSLCMAQGWLMSPFLSHTRAFERCQSLRNTS
jgi:hypothetical protein